MAISTIIPPFTATPLRTSPSTFSADTDTYHTELATFIASCENWRTEANTTQNEINAKALLVANQAVTGGYSQAYINANFNQVTTEVLAEGQSWDGINYVDPDAVGANPTAKIYPDGVITGSTDNGSYEKHPSGVVFIALSHTGYTANTNENIYYPILCTEALTCSTAIIPTSSYDTQNSIYLVLDRAIFRSTITANNILAIGVKGRWK